MMESVNSSIDKFMPWREEVNRILLRDYFIDLDMAGIDDEFLLGHCNLDQKPFEFVEWFAVKYDLHDFR
jgi:hypothetical protein